MRAIFGFSREKDDWCMLDICMTNMNPDAAVFSRCQIGNDFIDFQDVDIESGSITIEDGRVSYSVKCPNGLPDLSLKARLEQDTKTLSNYLANNK
jgi:hypothetical protein